MAKPPTELPLDLIISEILPRLSARSIGRSKSVCKQWRSILSTEEFARMNLRYTTTAANHKVLSIDQRSCYTHTIDFESPHRELTTTISPIPFKARPSDVLILASVDGLVCVCLWNSCELAIWNPVTRAFKKLPNSKFQGFYKPYSDAVGFYVDSSNDYRILHIQRRRGTMGVYIYSRRLDSWRKVKFLKKGEYASNRYAWSLGTFSGDSLYFMVSQYYIAGEPMIIAFDVNSEKFKEIRFPGFVHGVRCRGNLLDIKNRIHLFASYGFLAYKLHLWRMEGENCWMKVAVFPGAPDIPASWTATYVITNGRWLVLWDWDKDVYEIDAKTKNYVCVYPGNKLGTLQRAGYIETLVSPSI